MAPGFLLLGRLQHFLTNIQLHHPSSAPVWPITKILAVVARQVSTAAANQNSHAMVAETDGVTALEPREEHHGAPLIKNPQHREDAEQTQKGEGEPVL